jgi:hypothetical protein
MDTVESFAALYGDYARECVEKGIRPLLPQELAARLTDLDVPEDRTLH